MVISSTDDVVGKNVVVTGTTSGIGRVLALQYAKLGANVFITARKENVLKEVRISHAAKQFKMKYCLIDFTQLLIIYI